MLGTACGTNVQNVNLGTDPAVLASCPRQVESPGDFPGRGIYELPAATEVEVAFGNGGTINLPAGTQVVLLSQANARENTLLRGTVVFKDAYEACRSAVIYVEERDVRLADQ